MQVKAATLRIRHQKSKRPSIDTQLDLLIEEVETMKVTVQDHLTGLKTLGTKLKGIQSMKL